MRKNLAILVLAAIFLFVLLLVPLKNAFVVKDYPLSLSCLERVNTSEIQLEPERLIININNLSLSRYGNTSSMNPWITENAKGITIVPKSAAEIKVGDVVTYEQDDILIVHRVILLGQDKEGWYCVMKGDSTVKDDGKIRFSQIKSILVGILY
jgi:uncharacterized protein YfaT (DUF1175 family)